MGESDGARLDRGHLGVHTWGLQPARVCRLLLPNLGSGAWLGVDLPLLGRAAPGRCESSLQGRGERSVVQSCVILKLNRFSLSLLWCQARRRLAGARRSTQTWRPGAEFPCGWERIKRPPPKIAFT